MGYAHVLWACRFHPGYSEPRSSCACSDHPSLQMIHIVLLSPTRKYTLCSTSWATKHILLHHLIWCLSQLEWAAITQHYRLGGPNNRNFIFSQLWGPAKLRDWPIQSLVRSLLRACRWPLSHYTSTCQRQTERNKETERKKERKRKLWCLLLKGTNPIRSRLPLRTSLNRITFLLK